MESEANSFFSYGLRFCCDPLIRIHSRGQKDLGHISHAGQTLNACKWYSKDGCLAGLSSSHACVSFRL